MTLVFHGNRPTDSLIRLFKQARRGGPALILGVLVLVAVLVSFSDGASQVLEIQQAGQYGPLFPAQ